MHSSIVSQAIKCILPLKWFSTTKRSSAVAAVLLFTSILHPFPSSSTHYYCHYEWERNLLVWWQILHLLEHLSLVRMSRNHDIAKDHHLSSSSCQHHMSIDFGRWNIRPIHSHTNYQLTTLITEGWREGEGHGCFIRILCLLQVLKVFTSEYLFTR